MNSLSNTDKPTINVSYNFKFVDCNKKCESSPKIGKSWYKQFGYNSACQCLEAKVILNSMESCSYCFKLLDCNINDNIQCVEENYVCGDCYEKFYDYCDPSISMETIRWVSQNSKSIDFTVDRSNEPDTEPETDTDYDTEDLPSDNDGEYDCGCPTKYEPNSYIMTKDDGEAYICQTCYDNRENNEFCNWNCTLTQ